VFAALDSLFVDYALDNHVPGLIFGVVTDERLAYARGIGVRDLSSKQPVTVNTLFRIASMTKAFTALTVLKLRDEGRVNLDAPAELYIPELQAWVYPTGDSPRIRVRNLLNHTAGFVSDDPWGDRQTLLPEDEFSKLLREGVHFARAPGTASEYSNLGFALLGRIISNVSGEPFDIIVARTLLEPLDMRLSGFSPSDASMEDRATGYRWQDEAWHVEPLIPHGSFAAMGGLYSTAEEYAKWMAFLLSAWPPRDEHDGGPVCRASVRELAEGASFPLLQTRSAHPKSTPSDQAVSFGMGMVVAVDQELGLTLSHSGGYPGFGSHVLLLPRAGVGLFAFANRTYARMAAPLWEAALSLRTRGHLADRPQVPSGALATAYHAVKAMYAQGGVEAAKDLLAINFLMDRDEAGWARDLVRLKEQVGECVLAGPLRPTSALSGEFLWICAHGRIAGSLSLAPSRQLGIQQLTLARKSP